MNLLISNQVTKKLEEGTPDIKAKNVNKKRLLRSFNKIQFSAKSRMERPLLLYKVFTF